MTQPVHPYAGKPPGAFWAKSVARDWNPADLYTGPGALLKPDDRVVSAGSCFAGNIVPWLEKAGFNYVRTEFLDPEEDRFQYHAYSAGYGNIYTTRQLLQLVQRCDNAFSPVEDRWRAQGAIIDPYRPGFPYPAESDAEFDALTRSHLDMTREAFARATVFIFTLGLTEAWMSRVDGAVFPACPGTVAGEFDPERHAFVNFRVAEIVADLRQAIAGLRALNPKARVILTASPVPLAATATGQHVYVANAYSKAALRCACEEVASVAEDVIYFPSYEIIMGVDYPANFLENRRSVSESGIASVVAAIFRHCEMPVAPPAGASAGTRPGVARLSEAMVRYECEESLNNPDAAAN